MLLLKKNIYLLFFLIAFIGAMLFSAIVYHEYSDILKDAKNDQLYLSQLHQQRLEALFHEQETLHNLLAQEYSAHASFDKQRVDTVLSLNPLILDIWIFSPDGNLQYATLANAAFPNLLQCQNSQPWFKQTLASEHMVIGRAYLLESINKWILPLRKKITDQHGNTVAVSSIGIDLAMLQKQWAKNTYDQNTMQVIINDGAFPILHSTLTPEQQPYYYASPLADNSLFAQDLSQLKTRLSAKKDSNSESFLQARGATATEKVLYTLSYNGRYQFWTAVDTPYRLILQQVYQHCLLYFVIYLLIIMGIFLLFRWIDKIDKLKIAELTYKAEHDALTGLPNRTLLKKQFYKLQAEQSPFALLYLDLDNFKNMNDSFGHSYGDKVLIEVGQRIQQSLSAYKGAAARYSGDDFIIFLQSANKKEIAEYATGLLERIARPYLINNNHFRISSSVGIARFPDDAVQIEKLLSYADSSMALAKKNKEQYFFFSKEQHAQLLRHTEIEQALRHAIENKEISLVYQPQLDREQRLVGVEALVRWHSEELGFIGPDIFIPIAEESGLMPQLGLYIMDKAMQEIAALQQQQLTFRLSINVSVRQFTQVDFLDKLLQACALHNIDKSRISIEITESLFIESLDTLLPIFNEMKAQGITLSLDDFGTGYSSLNMLRQVPIDELKIDKSFVDHISDKQADKEMLKSIISMGKNLGISVLAEGVETPQQVAILQQAECDLFQGYYFSKPLTIDDLASFAEKQKNIAATARWLYQA